jgi:transcription-repair coupling factor (superfamily II helicase)
MASRATTTAYSLEGALDRSTADLPKVLRRLAAGGRVDLAGLPPGAVAAVLARAFQADGRPRLVVTPDGDAARRMAQDLAFFLGGAESESSPDTSDVLLYPSSEASPYLEVAPDRRASMDRMATLFHLAQGLPFAGMVVPAAALLRRVPPREAVAGRSLRVQAEEELDREHLLRMLAEGGYLRVPVAEDPGSFAVRGGIIDVFPPHASFPVRIELDDYLVMSLKVFDPDDQRTIEQVDQVFIHPVRDTLLGPAELALARERIRDLCEEVDMPTTKTLALLDDLDSGRAFFGIDGFLPAFHERLDSVFDYLPDETGVVLVDPTKVARAVDEDLEEAERDLAARRDQKKPAFPLDALYLDEVDLAEVLQRMGPTVVHRVAVAGRAGGTAGEPETAAGGDPDDGGEALPEGALARFETVEPDAVMHLGGEDHVPLLAELKAARGRGKGEALAPLGARARGWLDAGLRVYFVARTRTQADRLASVLKSYEVPAAPTEDRPLQPGDLDRRQDGKVRIAVGALSSGFVLPSEALVLVTEEEIFGGRTHRRTGKKKRRDQARAFLEDLRELKPGDYLVHVDHGIGRYLGLERKVMGQSAFERLKGEEPPSVEVLVIEYSGKDKLFLPVGRLNQVQKFSGPDGHKPKLDRLGGQTFSKTKARVQKAVRQMADELLRLYAERAAARRPGLPAADRTFAEFEATFPYDETPDQTQAIEDVLDDLQSDQPMDRIVCGDVGFGKTEVAIRAAFRVAMAGRQVALLCPTTVLAQQHFLTFRERMRDFPIRVETVSRFVERREQQRILAETKDGKVDVLVGTHRLLSKDVHFADLGMLIVDEEQRFGVAHKERIKQLRASVDVLTLTATPIPRTLQLAIGGLRDLSLITTAPVDRRAVRTLVSRWDEHVIREAIQRELNRGGQVFFVYNRVEGLYERANRLQELLPDVRLAVAHGQMKESGLEQVMAEFVDGRYDVLCCTAIIETGLDIPRANTIIIDRADIFGLSQLYQLRGRVGRSRERAYCYLVTPPPSVLTDEARFRIEALERFTELGSGFQVASLDMELRGAGDLLGAEQSGNVAAVGFDLFVQMLEEAVAQQRGEEVVHEVDPDLSVDLEHFLPDDYIDDVGLRLSFYKRFASALDEEQVHETAAEMEDRFGAAPRPAADFVRVMTLKPALRELRVLGAEASRSRVTLHLREDTPLDPAKVMELVGLPRSPYRLTPEMKLTRRFDEVGDGPADPVERLQTTIEALVPLRKDDAPGSSAEDQPS